MNIPALSSSTGDILVTDDTPANLRLLTGILVKHGYQVRAARSGAAALVAVQAKQPDLILLDIMMPEMDGFAVCEHLKANPNTCHIPVIFISALDHPADKARAFQVGGVDYIPKPFHREEVLLRVSHHLGLRRAQDALRASETRFRLIFENAGVGIFVAQPDGKILKTNQTFQRFLGYQSSQLYQMSCVDFLGEADREVTINKLRMISEGNLVNYETEQQYRRSDGQWIWGRITLCGAVQDEAVQFVFGMVENIDAQKQAQEALLESEREMRAIFQAMTDLVLIRDREGRCLKIAPTQAINTVSTTRLSGKTLDEIVPDSADRLKQAIQTTLDQQQMTKVEYQYSNDNQPTWFDARLFPLTEDTVVWVARDVTEDRLIANKLQQSEQEIRSIFEAMTDLVLVVNAEHQQVQVMPTNYSRLFNNSSAVISATFDQFFETESNNTFWGPIQQVLEEQLTFNVEYCLRLPEGSVWFAANISPLPNQSVIWVARDISDRIRAERELQSLAAELEQRVIERTTQLRRVNTNLRAEISDRIQAEANLAKSEARFRLAVDNIPNMFLIYDRHLRYRFVNTQALQTLGRRREDMVGRTDREIFPDMITQVYVPLLEKAVELRQVQAAECTLTIPQQGNLTFNVTYVPLLSSTGEIEQILGIAHDVTEQKRSERVIRQAKEQLQAVLDAVPGFVSWIGTLAPQQDDSQSELYYLGANHQLARAFGIQPQDFTGQRLGFLTSGDAFEQMLRDLFQSSEQTQSRVISMETKDKEQRHYLVVAQKYQQNQAAVSVGIEITARMKAETQLKHAYERSQLLSELTLKIRQSLDLDEILQTAVWEVHQILQTDRVAILQCNPEHECRAIKESVAENIASLDSGVFSLPSQGVDMLTPYLAIDDTEQYKGAPQHVLMLGGQPVRSQFLMPIFVQQHLWGCILVQQCQASHHWQSDEVDLLTALADQLGIAVSQAEFLNHLEERVAERTAELQLEIAERTKAEIALRESEAQLHRVIQSNAYGIVVCDRNGRINFANAASTELFGRPVDALLNFELGIPIPSGDRTEICLIHPQGQQCVVEMRSVEINWYGNTAYLLSLMDITERKAIEQMKDEFISIASHELRTPLTSIRGSLGLLATGRLGELSSKGQQMLEIAVNNTDRLTRLLNDILDLERIESGRIKLMRRHCDALELIQQAAQAMVSMAEQQNLTLCLECNQNTFAQYPSPDEGEPLHATFPVYIWVDPDQILQTLTNLISNAIKFSERDRTIWINIVPHPEQVVFSVHDQGRGIPPDKCDAIFGRFQQVDASDSREKGGTGLGLPICREIVRRHGGEIWVESVLGSGSTFYFSIPLKSDNS